MGRPKNCIPKKRALGKRRDTPRKSSLSRGAGLKKPVWTTAFETLPEDAEVKINPVQIVQPIPSIKRADLDTGAVSSEDVSPPSLVIDTSYSSDNEDSSVFGSSSSPPSPEIFREELYVEQSTLRLSDDVSDLDFPIKNSTLLEQSHAETILAHLPPNLSTINEAPTILAENGDLNINQDKSTNKSSPYGCKLTSDKEFETSFVNIKKVNVKKQVWFRSPLFSEKSRRENITTPKHKIQCRKIIPKQCPPSSPLIENTDDEYDDVDGGTFFDFSCDSERDIYFQEMRERYTKLQGFV